MTEILNLILALVFLVGTPLACIGYVIYVAVDTYRGG